MMLRALIVALVLRYLGLDANAAVQRCTERRPGALYNEVFKEYLLLGLVNPVPQAGTSSSAFIPSLRRPTG